MSDYEEDFEDYDDDGFEPEEPEEYDVLPNVQPAKDQAPPASIKQAPVLQSPQRKATSETTSISLAPPPVLTDVELRVRNKRLVASLQKMKKVQLKMVTMDDLLVLTALSEYDLYCMARGQYAACKVAAVQTNDDAKEEECQTEEVIIKHFGAQAPDDRNKMTDAEVYAFSVDTGHSSRRSTKEAGGGAGGGAVLGSATTRVMNMDPQMELKMAGFMQWAGPVMLAALGASAGSCQLSFSPASSQSTLVEGSIPLTWPDLLAQRPVTQVCMCTEPGQAQVLVAYGPVGAQLGGAQLVQDHGLTGKGCLCVWDLSAPAQPKAVLLSEGYPSCCAWAPAPAQHVVIAGMEEGGVCAWDLDEPAARHPTELLSGRRITARRPAFTTEAHADSESAAAIKAVCCVAKQGGERSSPCHVLSLTCWGHIHVFTLSLLGGMDGSAASDSDMGMRVGSRVRLMKSSGSVRLGLQALTPHLPAALQPNPVPCHCMAAVTGVTGPASQVLVGSEGRRTLRGSWLGTAPAPKVFIAVEGSHPAATSSEAARQLPSSITCISASPHCPQSFLVGLSNGDVALHVTSQAPAVMEWSAVGAGPLLALSWSPLKPTSFMVLDSACVVHCFDLSKSTTGPVASQAFALPSGEVGGMPALCTHMQLQSFLPEGRTSKPVPCVALGYDDGIVHVHQISGGLAQGDQAAELQSLKSILGVV